MKSLEFKVSGECKEKTLNPKPQILNLNSPMVLEIPGLFSSPYYADIDYPWLLSSAKSMGMLIPSSPQLRPWRL